MLRRTKVQNRISRPRCERYNGGKVDSCWARSSVNCYGNHRIRWPRTAVVRFGRVASRHFSGADRLLGPQEHRRPAAHHGLWLRRLSSWSDAGRDRRGGQVLKPPSRKGRVCAAIQALAIVWPIVSSHCTTAKLRFTASLTATRCRAPDRRRERVLRVLASKISQAPYLPRRPAFESARVIKYFASKIPRPPVMHSRSLKVVFPSGRQQSETSKVGTGCQLWLLR